MALSRYGGLWTYANATAIDVPRSDEDTVYLTFESGQGLGMDVDTTDGSITAKVPGTYMGFFNASFIGTTGVTYFFEFRENGLVGAGYRCTADGLTGGAVNVSMLAGSILEVGDKIQVAVYCDEDGESATIVDAQVGLLAV